MTRSDPSRHPISVARLHAFGFLCATCIALAGCGSSSSGGVPNASNFEVSVSRPVGGTITSSDGRIRCGTEGGSADVCSPVRYGSGETVSFSAEADPGYQFTRWGGVCSGTGACLIGIPGATQASMAVAAEFVPTVVDCAVANGIGTRTMIDGGYGPCTVTGCDAGFDDCDGDSTNGCEVGLQNDGSNCGACGHVCPGVANGTGACTLGACGVASCDAGFVLSSGACIPIVTACVVAHGTGTQTWSGSAYGTCNVVACVVGYADCDANPTDGCEVALQTDVNNCGACGRVCPAAGGIAVCIAGVCGVL